MALDLLKPVSKVVHDTAKQVVDNDIPKKTAEVVNTFVTSVFGIAEDALKKIVDLTEEKPAPSGGNP